MVRRLVTRIRRDVNDNGEVNDHSVDVNDTDYTCPDHHNDHQQQPKPRVKPLLPVSNPITSYWLSEPSPHANLRSTPKLPETTDIAVIGSGLSGILTAYHILSSSPQDSPPSILLLDARPLCSGATARNGGHAKVKTATLTALKDSAARNEFQSYVRAVILDLKHIVETEHLDCEFELRRSFDVFCDAEELAGVKSVFDDAVQKKEAWTERVAYVDGKVAEQVTSVKGAKGAFSVETASFWPYKLATGLVDVMLRRWHGALNVQTNTAVTALVQDDAGRNVLTTPRGRLAAGKIVLATNAYTAGLAPVYRGTILPYKGMASHHAPSRPVHPHLNQTYNLHFAKDEKGRETGVDYLNPRPDGGIVVGGGKWMYEEDKRSWDGNWDDSVGFGGRVEGYWGAYMQKVFLGW